MLRYYADWPDLEIATVMGISGRAVNAHIRRGLSAPHDPRRYAPGWPWLELQDPGALSADGRFRRTGRFSGRLDAMIDRIQALTEAAAVTRT